MIGPEKSAPSPEPLVLSADPGTSVGAACLRRGSALLAWWVWTRTTKGYRVTSSVRTPRIADWMGHIGSMIANDLGGTAHPDLDRLVIEGLFAQGSAILCLVESVGEFRAGLRFGGLRWASELRPLAVSRSRKAVGWRRAVLGLPDSMGAAPAEAAAIEWAAAKGLLPRGLSRAEQGAVAEAAAISLFEPPTE